MSVEEMKDGLRERLRAAIRRQKNNGVVAMSVDNLWQVTDLRGWDGPTGTNCAAVAKEMFRELCQEERFKSFIITPEYYEQAKRVAAERRAAVESFDKELAKLAFEKSTGGVKMDEANVDYYRKGLEAFDAVEWRKPKDIGVDFHLAETLHAFDLLERRTVNRMRNGLPCGNQIWFRLAEVTS